MNQIGPSENSTVLTAHYLFLIGPTTTTIPTTTTTPTTTSTITTTTTSTTASATTIGNFFILIKLI